MDHEQALKALQDAQHGSQTREDISGRQSSSGGSGRDERRRYGLTIETKQAGVQENPIAQGTGGGTAVIVYPERVELRSRLHSKNTCSVGLGRVTSVRTRGLINCALTIEINDGRRLHVEGMALPDARQIKAATERQRRTTGLEVTSASGPQNANPDEDKAH